MFLQKYLYYELYFYIIPVNRYMISIRDIKIKQNADKTQISALKFHYYFKIPVFT